jgi:cell division septation protein DedD
VSPAARRRTVPLVGARLARHYLAGARLDARGAAFVDVYLRHVPEDDEVAEGWAAQAEQRGGLAEDQQELAGRLFRRHPDNAVIARVAARLFLLLERRDYDALQCYRRACAPGQGAPAELRAELERALGRAGGAQEPPRPAEGRAAVPAAARPADRAPERSEPAAAWAEADEPDPPFRMTAPAAAEDEDEEPQHPDARSWGSQVRAGLRAAGVGLSGLLRAWSSRLRVLQAPGRTLAARQVLGATAVAGLGAILVWLVATAMSDYFSRPPEAPVAAEAPAAEPPPAITDDPYTLQVAAYLKQEYALRLVEDLKRKGLDAYWTETSSGGKVYHQVRISHFRDQQSARDFGRSLKSRGLIEDFYVTNYVR